MWQRIIFQLAQAAFPSHSSDAATTAGHSPPAAEPHAGHSDARPVRPFHLSGTFPWVLVKFV